MNVPMINFAEIMQAILVMSISGSVIALLLFFLKPLIKDKLPKLFQYYMWIVVLLALLIPVSQIVVLPESNSSSDQTVSLAPIYGVVQQGVFAVNEVPDRIVAAPQNVLDPEIGNTQNRMSDAAAIIAVVWIFGVLVFIGFSASRYYQFSGRLENRAMPANDHEIRMLNELSGPRRTPRLYRNTLVPTPMLIGLFRPTIMLPDRDYTDSQLRNILLHELTHHRRFDIGMKWLSVLAGALHWFNPVIYLARREINTACELACDEAIIRNFDKCERQDYGDTLISVVASHRISKMPLSTTMCEEKKALKERLGSIMKHKRFSRASIVLSCILFVIVISGSVVLGAASGRDNDTTPVYQVNEDVSDRDAEYNEAFALDVVSRPDEEIHENSRNTISPYSFHNNEYSLTDLVLMGTTARIFSFNVAEDYQNIAIWCDVYRNGELVYTSLPLRHNFSVGQDTEGSVAIVLESDSMRLNIKTPSSGSSIVFELGDNQPVREGSFWQESDGLSKTVDIVDNEEIKLFVHASDVNSSILHPPEHFPDNPEAISQYDYFLIVTCVFY